MKSKEHDDNCHSRESGNPAFQHQYSKSWFPTSVGMTREKRVNEIRTYKAPNPSGIIQKTSSPDPALSI
jgi:hypothetical protein